MAPRKVAKWARRPKGPPADGEVWAEVALWDHVREVWVAYNLVVNGDGEELILSRFDLASEETVRFTLSSGGSECSCGNSDRRGGCDHQAALRHLKSQGV